MSFFPRSPARPDRNSNSAYEKLKFVEEHYEQLMAAYQDIMAHLKLVGNGSSGSSSEPVELPDNIVTYDPDSRMNYSASVPNWNTIVDGQHSTDHKGVTMITGDDMMIDETPPVWHIPAGALYLSSAYANYNEYHWVCSDGSILFNVNDLITTKHVGNEASKIPIYTEEGHLQLPDGTELWCEDAE